jgi:hypothetical protein
MFLTTVSVLGLTYTSPNQVTLAQIHAARKATYCESCPAGRLKVFANFRLVVEEASPALGADYFPMSDLTGKLINLNEWREETFRSGRKYKERVVNPVPKGYGGPFPGTYDLTLCYNGIHSWRYRPGDRVSERFNGVNRATQIVQDYFGDLIGSKILGGSAEFSRTVPAPSDTFYDIDQVVESDLYEVVGEEVVSGEMCTIIERPKTDRIWLAKEKNYVVVQREWRWTTGGPLKRRITNSQFRSVGAAWLPFEGRMEIFGHPSTRPGRRVGVLTALVEAADTSFPDSEFEPDFLKGTFVFDVEAGTRSVAGYTEEEIAAQEAKDILKKVMVRKAANALAFKAEPWWRSTWIATLGIAGIIVVAAYIGFRHRGGA